MKNYKRESGILLHVSSLPNNNGIGTLGKEAYGFIDFLKKTNTKIWQILPLGHTSFGNSPYSSYSAFAGNPLLINLEKLNFSDKNSPDFNNEKVDFEEVKKYKLTVLKELAKQFLESNFENEDFEKFKKENNFWLADYCFFIALKDFHKDKPLREFDKKIIERDEKILLHFKNKLSKEIEINSVIQFFFFQQWFDLKQYANNSNVEIIGDLPLYIAEDSADVWANPEIFMLDKDYVPTHVAGVPPDYFSETGQLWGNPVYDWASLKKTNYEWWIQRLKFNFKLFNIVRIDHFRALSEFWAIPFGSENAIKGEWLPAGNQDFMDAIFDKLGKVNLIAEDLGVITEDVEKLRDDNNLPGMKILQFAFESDSKNPFLPHEYTRESVVYTGTHDNDTTLGWYKELSEKGKDNLKNYANIEGENIPKKLIKLAWSSVSELAIAPLQDFLELGTDARMNLPGTIGDNWNWRLKKEDLNVNLENFLIKINKIYNR